MFDVVYHIQKHGFDEQIFACNQRWHGFQRLLADFSSYARDKLVGVGWADLVTLRCWAQVSLAVFEFENASWEVETQTMRIVCQSDLTCAQEGPTFAWQLLLRKQVGNSENLVYIDCCRNYVEIVMLRCSQLKKT